MRIAFCTWKFPALANTFILNEIVEVRKRGHDVWIYSIDRSDDAVVHDDVHRYGLLDKTSFLADLVPENGGGEFERYTGDWLRDKVRAFRPLARRLRKDGIDVVHGCFINNSATVAMVAARLAGLPFTCECHAHDLFVDLRYGAEKIAAADGIFAISEYNRRHLIDELECPPEKVAIKRVPILTEFCDGIPEVAREDGLIVSVGRLHPIKGFEDALDAFALVARRDPRARYLIIGDGELEGALRAKTERLGLTDRVEFAGSLKNEDVLARVARASVSLLASVITPDGDRDGIPTSLIESMYLRTPAVSTRVSGIPELIDDGVNGMLADPGDVATLAAKVEEVLADSELRDRLGTRARAKVESEFDSGRNIDVLVDRWSEIVASRRGFLRRLRRLLTGA